MTQTWTVVKFLEENTVEAVPTIWLLGNTCYWPPYTREKVIHSIRNYDEPNTCWPSHKISIFRNGTFDNYLEARNKTKVAEYSSDLNEEDPKSRKYRKQRNVISSEEGESEEEVPSLQKIPPPPSKPPITSVPSVPSVTSGNSEASSLELTVIPSISDEENICRCCPIHGRHQVIDEQMKKIMKQYYFIGNILTDISTKIDNIMIHRPALEEVDSLFTKFSFFPLSSAEHLTEIEEYLGDNTNFKTACNELSKMGGNSIYEFVRRCMSQIMTNSFAATYSYHGRKNKLKFIGLKIADLIINAAEIHGNGKTTKKEIEDSIMKWLRRAAERK